MTYTSPVCLYRR